MNYGPEISQWKAALTAPFDTGAACDRLEELAKALPRRRLPDGLSVGLDHEEPRCGGCSRPGGQPLCSMTNDTLLW